MAICGHCGTDFDVAEARDAVNAEYDGDIDYDEEMNGEVCGDCSISKFDSDIELWDTCGAVWGSPWTTFGPPFWTTSAQGRGEPGAHP